MLLLLLLLCCCCHHPLLSQAFSPWYFSSWILNQQWSHPLRLPVSDCGTCCIMCDVPSIAVFGSKSIECFPCVDSRFFFKPSVTTPMAPVITGIIIHFMFYSHCISILKRLYCSLFSASFCMKFLSVGIATFISMHFFSLLFLIIISGLFAVISLSVCTHWFQNTVTYCSHSGVCICVCAICLSF